MDNRIKELRKKESLNQREFAEAIGVSRQSVSSIENGRYDPSLELAFIISDLLGKSIEEIFFYKRDRKHEKE